VFSDKIDDKGLSMSSLKSISRCAVLLPCEAFVLTNETGTDKITASATEHKNDTESANNKYKIRTPMIDLMI
jgi:hypothetical protein